MSILSLPDSAHRPSLQQRQSLTITQCRKAVRGGMNILQMRCDPTGDLPRLQRVTLNSFIDAFPMRCKMLTKHSVLFDGMSTAQDKVSLGFCLLFPYGYGRNRKRPTLSYTWHIFCWPMKKPLSLDGSESL